MKHSRAFTALLLCLSLSPAAASEFDDYRIPASSWRRWDLSFGGDGSRSSSNPTGSYERVQSWRGDLTGGFALGRDSDPLLWDATLLATLYGSRLGATLGQYGVTGSSGSTYSLTRRSRNRVLGENWHLSGGARWYPGVRRVGLELRGSVQGNDLQSWSGDDVRRRYTYPTSVLNDESMSSAVEWVYREDAQLSGTVGLGRVRDASPVFHALLLEERLQRDGRLQREPTPAARQRLAELLSLRDDFSRVHAFPEKFFWSEVERVLREDGALVEGGLDGFAALHAAEVVVVARGFLRRVGWFAGPTLSARHSHELRRRDQTTGSRVDDEVNPPTTSLTRTASRSTTSSEALLAGVRAEYRRPLGPRLQADVAGELLTRVTGDDRLRAAGEARLERLVAERWFAAVYASNLRVIAEEETLPSGWSVATGGMISYFLEDFCRVSLSLDRYEWSDEWRKPIARRDHSVVLASRLSVSLGRGRLDAPGLTAPVRPLH